MKAVADENIPGLEHTFAKHMKLHRVPGRTLSRRHLQEAEVLLVRSVTPVTRELLEDSAVRFVATATIGTDHLETSWLSQNGIHWASAPGCNASAAAQYTLGMILLACRRLERKRENLTVGIFGRGQVGREVERLLQSLAVETRACDPPLQAQGESGLVPARQALACDVVSLHVPLTRSGPWPTEGMIGEAAIRSMKPGALLVNSARGGVVGERALQDALACGRIHAALDVWPREPAIDRTLLEATTVATPHVAGYSVEGKLRGTQMIYEAFLDWRAGSNSSAGPSLLDNLPCHPLNAKIEAPRDDADVVSQIIIDATGVEADDSRMHSAGIIDARRFDALRRAHAPRHEFEFLTVGASGEIVNGKWAEGKLADEIQGLGFNIARTS